jgi:hypothetical protein
LAWGIAIRCATTAIPAFSAEYGKRSREEIEAEFKAALFLAEEILGQHPAILERHFAIAPGKSGAPAEAEDRVPRAAARRA